MESSKAVKCQVGARRWLPLALGVLAGAAALVALLRWRAQETPLPPGAHPVELGMLLVDDEENWAKAVHVELPPGVFLRRESLPLGDGNHIEVHYLLADISAGEGKQRGLSRIGDWLSAHAPLPEGKHHALQWSPAEQGRGGEIRSFVTKGAPFLTNADVAEAQPHQDEQTAAWGVQVALTKRGAEALREATTRQLGRRMAILFDGVVMVAPLIVGPLEGGHVVITLGPDADEAEAKLLAAGLGQRLYAGSKGP